MALFHLVNHAFFKALLFLAAGSVIHAMADQQDLRRLGGLVNFLPFTYTAILIGSLSLMAFPFLTGFYSKDLILEVALGQYELSGNVAYWLGTISAVFTAFYSLRLVSLTFFTVPNAPKGDYLHTHEAPTIIVIPLVILSIMSIVFGYIAKDLFVGVGSDFLSTALFQHPDHISLIEAEFGLPLMLKLLPAIGSVFGAGLALYLYHVVPQFTIGLTNTTLGNELYRFFNGKWYVDVVYNNYVINGGLRLGFTISKVLDRGLIEMCGPQGLTTSLFNTSGKIASYDTGVITSYALYIILGLISMIYLLFVGVLFDLGTYSGGMELLLVCLCTAMLLPHANNTSLSQSPSYQLARSYYVDHVKSGGMGLYRHVYNNHSGVFPFLICSNFMVDSYIIQGLLGLLLLGETIRLSSEGYKFLISVYTDPYFFMFAFLTLRVVWVFTTYSIPLCHSLQDSLTIDSVVSMLPLAHCEDSILNTFIPWVNTNSLAKGIEALNRMYLDLDEGTSLHTYITDNCLHLLAPLTGHTGIPVDTANPRHLVYLPSTVSLGNEFSTSYVKGLKSQAGIYVLYEVGTERVEKCGSNIDYYKRLLAYYNESPNSQPAYNRDTMRNYHYTPLGTFTNYLADYASLGHEVTELEDTYLTAFTQQQARSLEQAYSTYASPSSYKGIQVCTSHNRWISGDILMYGDNSGKPVTWITEDLVSHSAPSLAKASQTLDISRKELRRVCNSDIWYPSPNVGKVQINIEALPLQNPSNLPSYYRDLPINNLVDLESLPSTDIYLYNPDMSLSDIPPVTTEALLNEVMGTKSTMRLHNYFNKLHQVAAPALGGAMFYLVRRDARSKGLIVTCLETGDVTPYPSMNKATHSLTGVPKMFSLFTKRHIINGQTFTQADGKTYKVEYANKMDLVKAITRYGGPNKS